MVRVFDYGVMRWRFVNDSDGCAQDLWNILFMPQRNKSLMRPGRLKSA
jgi:hypothetical protein